MPDLAPQTDQQFMDDLTAVIAIQASRLNRRYYRWVDIADLRQEMWLHVLKRKDRFSEYMMRDDPDERRKGWAAVHKSVWRAGDQYCRKAKADSTGYRTSDESFYDREQVRSLMEMKFSGTSLTNQVDDRPKVKRIPGSGYMLETSMADIEQALKRLTDEERDILVSVYGLDQPEEEVAETYGMTRAKLRRTVQRACSKMIEHLGGESPW